MTEPRVIVLGGGVAGLTCGVRLAETRRFDVTLVAEKIGLESLSRIAGASWYPHHVRHPRLDLWLAASLAEFRALAAVTGSGVTVRRAIAVGVRERPPFDASALPFAWRDGSWHFETPIIDMPVYLPLLLARFERAGGSLRRERVRKLDDLATHESIVVNCTGAEARALVPDPRVAPTLGQIVRVAGIDVDTFRVDATEPTRPTYVVPRGGDVVLGTIDVPWPADAKGFEPPAPDPRVSADIVARCTLLDPTVARARILEDYCGLRPVRDEVRVEIDAVRRATGLRVIHDYGHGGAGVTLSWGCAEDVVALARSLAS